MKECKCNMKINENSKSVDIVDAYRSMILNCNCGVKE